MSRWFAAGAALAILAAAAAHLWRRGRPAPRTVPVYVIPRPVGVP